MMYILKCELISLMQHKNRLKVNPIHFRVVGSLEKTMAIKCLWLNFLFCFMHMSRVLQGNFFRLVPVLVALITITTANSDRLIRI